MWDALNECIEEKSLPTLFSVVCKDAMYYSKHCSFKFCYIIFWKLETSFAFLSVKEWHSKRMTVHIVSNIAADIV